MSIKIPVLLGKGLMHCQMWIWAWLRYLGRELDIWKTSWLPSYNDDLSLVWCKTVDFSLGKRRIDDFGLVGTKRIMLLYLQIWKLLPIQVSPKTSYFTDMDKFYTWCKASSSPGIFLSYSSFCFISIIKPCSIHWSQEDRDDDKD